MSKYDEYDARLLQAIRNGADTNMVMAANKDLKALAEPHRVVNRWGKTEYYRIVDRRLQALRKKGVIAYFGQRWQVVNKQG